MLKITCKWSTVIHNHLLKLYSMKETTAAETTKILVSDSALTCMQIKYEWGFF